MFSKIVFSVVFVIFLSLLNTWFCTDLVHLMLEDEVVPDVIPVAPHDVCQVIYRKDVNITPGRIFFESQDLLKPPVVYWKYRPDKFYTILITNPDMPNCTHPYLAEWHLWLVVNIPAGNFCYGDELTTYELSQAPRMHGLRRNILLCYEQPRKLFFDEYRRTNHVNHRSFFNTYKFVQKYRLGDPICGNYWFTQD